MQSKDYAFTWKQVTRTYLFRKAQKAYSIMQFMAFWKHNGGIVLLPNKEFGLLQMTLPNILFSREYIV